jgi:hypothetical protein
MEEPEAPYKLTFEERDGYLLANIKAEILEYDAAQDCLLEVAREIERLKLTRLMVHREIPSVMPRGQLFFTSANMAESFKHVRVAFVNPYPDLDEALNFGALTANNRGAKFNVFGDIETAEKWLLKSQ